MTSAELITFDEPTGFAHGLPDGTTWPDAHTLVLANRQIRPGADPARLSRFADDRWDLNPAIFEDHARSQSLNFEVVAEPLRQATKHYTWQLINHSRARTLRQSGSRIAIHTIEILFYGALQHVLNWFADQGVTQFCQVTDEMLWDYLKALDQDRVAVAQRYRRITEVRRLWMHRQILPPLLRLPQAPPWDGEDTQDLLEQRRADRENRTKRISEHTMQALLGWAVRFVENFSHDIVPAWDEHRRLLNLRPEHLRGKHSRRPRGGLQDAVANYLDRLRERGEPLPGKRRADGTLEPAWRHIAAQLRCAHAFQSTPSGRMITDSGLPVDEHIYLDTAITADLDGHLWHPRITVDQVSLLARLLQTACFVIVAYLSGARVGEVLNLRRGCVSFDPAAGLWLMEGLYFKGAEDGNKIPHGAIREEPWVVIELVAHAVEVLERLHESHLLFPNRLKPRNMGPEVKRRGEARSDRLIAVDLAEFTAWVNEYCHGRDRTDLIPADPGGPIAASRFRRTLAWFIRRRPRGLIAASIQYGPPIPECCKATRGPTRPDSSTTTPSRTGCSAWKASPRTNSACSPVNTSADQPPTPTATVSTPRPANSRAVSCTANATSATCSATLSSRSITARRSPASSTQPKRPASSEAPRMTPWSPRTPTTVDPAAATSPAPTATSPASRKRPTNWPRSSTIG